MVPKRLPQEKFASTYYYWCKCRIHGYFGGDLFVIPKERWVTEKSDVYSFGVVLAELLTGEKALSFARSEEKANLAIYFLSCLKENCLFEALQVGILNEDNKQEIIEVANITAKCLSLKGEERPYMKEVAVKLEGIREMSQQQWVNNADNNFEETQSPERHDSIANDEEALLSLAYGR
ncbi:hypothetical protein HN51_017133 [Arachis hypogaea]